VQNVNEFRDRTVKVAECFTNEMLASTCSETEYHFGMCRATNGVHEHIRNFVRYNV